MRKGVACVLMMTLCLLTGCSGGEQQPDAAETARAAYGDMSGATMEANVTFTWNGEVRQYRLKCDYVPEKQSTVEVLEPETLTGVKATLDGETLQLSYEEACVDAGTVSDQDLSPAAVLPRLMDALREGWLLEQSREKWEETDCLRLTVDTTGNEGGKLLWTYWLEEATGLPIRAEVAVDGENIFTAAFTNFVFHATMTENG